MPEVFIFSTSYFRELWQKADLSICMDYILPAANVSIVIIPLQTFYVFNIFGDIRYQQYKA